MRYLSTQALSPGIRRFRFKHTLAIIGCMITAAHTTNETTSFLNRWLKQRDESGRWFLWAPVGLGVGIGLFFGATNEPSIWAGPTLLALFSIMALAPVCLRKTPGSKSIIFIIVGLTLALGFTAAGVQTHRAATTLLPPSERFVTIEGRIERIERRPARTRLTLTVTTIDPELHQPLPKKLRVSVSKQTMVDIGDLISVRAVIRGPGSPTVPGGFDFRRWSWFQQFGGSGFAVGPVTILAHTDKEGWQVSLNRLRDRIATRIRDEYPNQAGAVAVAVIVGDRSGLSEETLEAMRASGLAHLLAISGLHLGLLAGTVFFALRFVLAGFESFALDLPVKKIAASLALIASLFYVVLAGAPIPTVRAFIMTGLVLVAVLTDRSAISMRLVAWAAAVILLLQPESMLGPSFQMSFAAVVALVAFYESIIGIWRDRRAHAGPVKVAAMYFAGIMITTVIAGSATAPFAWHHFGQVGGYGAIANLIAIPIMAFFVMPFALLGLLAMPFGLEAVVLWPAIIGLDTILEVARTIGAMEGAMIRLPALSTMGLMAIVTGGLWLCLWRKKWRHFGWAGIAIGTIIGLTAQRPDIVVAGSAKLIGVGFYNSTPVLALNAPRKEKFVSEQWFRAYGYQEVVSFPDAPEGTGFHCDLFGCVLERNGWKVALVHDPRALIDDCVLVDVIVSPIPVYEPRCDKPDHIIDFFSLYREGTHAIYLSEDSVRIETAAPSTTRLWQQAGAATVGSNTGASDRRVVPEH